MEKAEEAQPEQPEVDKAEPDKVDVTEEKGVEETKAATPVETEENA